MNAPDITCPGCKRADRLCHRAENGRWHDGPPPDANTEFFCERCACWNTAHPVIPEGGARAVVEEEPEPGKGRKRK